MESLVVYLGAGLAACAAVTGTLLLIGQLGTSRLAPDSLPGDRLQKILFAAGMSLGALVALMQALAR